jgi:ssDNA-binding Zn-finger/Zn-ribbon topoisomerase 1
MKRYPEGWVPKQRLPGVQLRMNQIAITHRMKLSCPVCERGPMRLIDGPYGRFYGCKHWPDCVSRIAAEYDGTPKYQKKKLPPKSFEEQLLTDDFD